MTTPRSDGRGDIPSSVVAAVTVLLLGVLAAVVYLTATGKDVTNVFLVLTSVIAPTIASFVAVRKLSDVQHKVDGKIDNLITDKSNLETQVAQAGLLPVTARVSFDPETTGPMPRVPPAPNAATTEMPARRRHAPENRPPRER